MSPLIRVRTMVQKLPHNVRMSFVSCPDKGRPPALAKENKAMHSDEQTRFDTSYCVLKVNDQLVAYATGFLAVRLKNYVRSHHRALKTKVQCDFSSAYSPDHTNVLRLINININKYKHRYNTTRHQVIKLHHFPFIGVCSIRHL